MVCRTARVGAGLRQIDVATAAGVSHEVISAWERGARTPKALPAIVAAYERECGLRSLELWERAITHARDARGP